MVEQKKAHLERLRVLDLGCGSGDGYDLIMGVTAKDPGIYEYITAVITPDMLEEYAGIEINDELIKQAEADYGHYPKVRFIQDDLSTQEQRDLIMRLHESGYFTEKEAKERAHMIEAEKIKNKQQKNKEAKMSRKEQREKKVVQRIRKVINVLEEVKDAMTEEEIDEVLALFVGEEWVEGGEDEFDMTPPPPKPTPNSQ